MTSLLEYSLKNNVLPQSVANASATSPEFRAALAEIATVYDCVDAFDSLNIEYRTRYEWDSTSLYCKEERTGATTLDDPKITENCPLNSCLGTFCHMPTPYCISFCNPNFIFKNATLESCPTTTLCNTSNLSDASCSGGHCVYCPSNGSLPCVTTNIDNQTECQLSVACELPNGEVLFGLSEEECRAHSVSCSVDCPGESCQSISNASGVCVLTSATNQAQCESFGGGSTWFNGSICVLPKQTNQSCLQSSPNSVWQTCSDYSVGTCVQGTPVQKYLGGYVSLWHPCNSQTECESSGRCTDRDATVIVRSTDYPPNVQYGVCVWSGRWLYTDFPVCEGVGNDIRTGCLNLNPTSRDLCTSFLPYASYTYQVWMEPALTQSACLAYTAGRFGCLLTEPKDWVLWIFAADECSCKGGQIVFVWDWIPGKWYGGVPRSLEWRPAEIVPQYSYSKQLSIILLSQWLLNSVEESFLPTLKSEVVCQSQYLLQPLKALVCDCIEGGSFCYSSDGSREVYMGYSIACHNQVAKIKDPSAQITFSTNSILTDCTIVNISIIYRNWFSAPYIPPPASFQWENERSRDVVVNENQVTIGVLLGDGVSLSFSESNLVGEFRVCLRLSMEYDAAAYPIRTFGYSDPNWVSIYPLDISINITTLIEGVSTFWCSDVDFKSANAVDGIVRLYPIAVIDGYQTANTPFVSTTTEALMYTLGVMYCLLGFGFFIMLSYDIFLTLANNEAIKGEMPFALSILFLILSVFRAVFMFLYPIGTFAEDPLEEFVIFEIPTFLHCCILIVAIYGWKSVVYKKGFFPDSSNKYIVIFGFAIIWAIWIVVTVVYAEVILANNSGESPCLGRVPVSYDKIKQDSRDLAITYQVVIIAVTIALCLVFLYYTWLVFQTSKSVESAKRFVISVGLWIIVSFIIRCILFIIYLALDLVSSIYMFITLLLTEVIPFTMLFFQFNLGKIKKVVGVTDGATTATAGGSSVEGSGGSDLTNLFFVTQSE